MREIIDYIYGIPKFSKKCSLDNTAELLRRLGVTDVDGKIIHVAGTNGKGSVCTYLEGILRSAGKSTGVFTSPHLVKMNERIRINGVDVDDVTFANSYNKVKAISLAMAKDGFMHPSFFEFLFGMAMDIFAANELDYIILETGLGGRLDATNVFAKPLLSIITSISLDHTDILGDTYGKIALEKAGIIKAGVPVIFGDYNNEVTDVILRIAKERKSPVHMLNPDDIRDISKGDKYIDFSLCNGYYDNGRFRINSRGMYQSMNAALAIMAAAVIGSVSEDDVCKGLLNARWIGRMQEVDRNMILDGAHNEDGMKHFLESVKADGYIDDRILMFSAVKDKHYEDMIRMVCESGLFAGYILVPINDSRGLSVKVLEDEFKKHTDCEISVMDNLSQGIFEACMQRDGGKMIYIAGSLYLVGEILELRV